MADFMDRNRNEIERIGINAIGWVEIEREASAELNCSVDLVGFVSSRTR